MYSKTLLTLFTASAFFLSACSGSETPSQAPTPPPEATAAPTEPPSELKQIQEQRSGDYVITVLNETGDLKQGANNLTLEFRRTTDNQLADVGAVRVESTMEMQGMGPMKATTSVTPSGTPGRYNIAADLAMAGEWKTVVIYGDNQQVQLSLNPK